ncbi:MAG: hypothetical protein JNJ60_06785 [Rhodocyclaceae bacterium]|nr:hypothetical protein [Rhodocyclaceae bacterium]
MSVVHRHEIYGLFVESPVRLPGVPSMPAFPRPADLRLTWEPESAWNPVAWRVTRPAHGASIPDIGVTDDGWTGMVWQGGMYCLICPQQARVRIICSRANLDSLPTLFVGLVLGYILCLRGRICLHAAVLAHGGQASALLASGGVGKSTLATAMIARGAQLWSDDVAVLAGAPDAPAVERGSLGLRVTAETAAKLLGPEVEFVRMPHLDKYVWDLSAMVDAETDGAAALPLRALYVLTPEPDWRGAPELGPPLPSLDALLQLTAAWYPPGYLSLLGANLFDALKSLALQRPVRRVRYGRNWEQLPDLAAALLA